MAFVVSGTGVVSWETAHGEGITYVVFLSDVYVYCSIHVPLTVEVSWWRAPRPAPVNV